MYIVIFRLGAMKRSFSAAVSVVNNDPIALLRQLDAFLIRKLEKSPKRRGSAGRLAMVEAIRAAVLLYVAIAEIRVSPQCLDHLPNQLLCFDRSRVGGSTLRGSC